MKKLSLLFSAGFFAIIAFIVVSCEKNDLPQASVDLSATDIALAHDDAVADDIYNDVDADVLTEIQILDENDFQSVSLKTTNEEFPCLTVTVDYPDTLRFPKVITLDYGDGCTFIINGDTITKKGIIIVTLTDKFYVPGAQRIVTFNEFYMNEVKVEGVLTSTFNGVNDNDLLEYTMTLEDGKLIYDESSVYTREARHKKEWLRSEFPIEDTLFISGSSWGINIEGEEYSREIIDELVLAHCPSYGRRWVIVDGQVESTVGDETTLIDYSDGGCDGTAVIARKGIRHRIRIRERHRHRFHIGN